MIFSSYSRKAIHKGELLYIGQEYSLYFSLPCPNIDVGIAFGESTELGVVLELNEIVNINGYSPKSSWIRQHLNFPNSRKGCLLVNFERKPNKGECLSLDPHCLTYYDEKAGFICIGDYRLEDSDDSVEFADNIIAVVREGKLVAVWAKIRET